MARQSGAAEVQRYEWDRLPDMPTARCYSAGAYHKGKLYVIGEFFCEKKVRDNTYR